MFKCVNFCIFVSAWIKWWNNFWLLLNNGFCLKNVAWNYFLIQNNYNYTHRSGSVSLMLWDWTVCQGMQTSTCWPIRVKIWYEASNEKPGKFSSTDQTVALDWCWSRTGLRSHLRPRAQSWDASRHETEMRNVMRNTHIIISRNMWLPTSARPHDCNLNCN